jgi:hypothetical protein
MLGLWSEAKDLNHMVMVSGPDLVMGCLIVLDIDAESDGTYKY